MRMRQPDPARYRNTVEPEQGVIDGLVNRVPPIYGCHTGSHCSQILGLSFMAITIELIYISFIMDTTGGILGKENGVKSAWKYRSIRFVMSVSPVITRKWGLRDG